MLSTRIVVWLYMHYIETAMNLLPVGFLYILGNQYIKIRVVVSYRSEF